MFFADQAKSQRFDLDQLAGCEVVIIESGIRRREARP
jgi:hypothetical protein